MKSDEWIFEALRSSKAEKVWTELMRKMETDIVCALGIPSLMYGEYRNPFSILYEFDLWFQFAKRKAAGEETRRIIWDMRRHVNGDLSEFLVVEYSSFRYETPIFHGRYWPIQGEA